jgi:hypothetical protein
LGNSIHDVDIGLDVVVNRQSVDSFLALGLFVVVLVALVLRIFFLLLKFEILLYEFDQFLLREVFALFGLFQWFRHI